MADAVFLALTVITIGSAIAALELRSLIYGSIALMGTLGGIAGFFFLLDSPFVALFQLAVYVGSIAVLILFTVMLVKRELIFKKIEDKRRKFAGIALMLVTKLCCRMNWLCCSVTRLCCTMTWLCCTLTGLCCTVIGL